jgi:predicted O-methyltransferase YrrM
MHPMLRRWGRGRTPRLANDERAVIEAIESARARLEASSESVETIDYGAGPGGMRTDEEMERGVPVIRNLGELCRSSSKPSHAARLLFRLVRERRPDRCLELGTCLGISAAYQAAALDLNGRGSLITMEGAPALAERAGILLDELGLGSRVDIRVGRFVDLLPDVLQSARFDLAFVDGHHDENATLDYFRRIVPAMRAGGLLVFDDIGWSDGMARAWRVIRSDPSVEQDSERLGFGLAVVRSVVDE